MKTVTIIFDRTWPGNPENVAAGETVSVRNAPGCLLRDMAGNTLSTPFTAPSDMYVRLDCVTYTGPATATLEIV
jgi:hypothetical protein